MPKSNHSAPAGAQSQKTRANGAAPPSGSPPDLPDLAWVEMSISDEQNIARLLHRMAEDIRDHLTIGDPVTDWMAADIDVFCSELRRLESRLKDLSNSLDIPGGAEIVACRPARRRRDRLSAPGALEEAAPGGSA